MTGVQREALEIHAREKNAHYLLTKKTRLGHILTQAKFQQ
jgi:GTP cyclohydrolase II